MHRQNEYKKWHVRITLYAKMLVNPSVASFTIVYISSGSLLPSQTMPGVCLLAAA